MASHRNTNTHTQHRHVVHFNCLTVWSNSKWICDLSIDSFSPRLWIKCFNYWCTDVRCPLECCMWCRPLSPGKLLSPPRSQPNSTPPPPPLPSPLPQQTPSCSPLSEHALPGMNGTWTRCRQLADRRQPIGRGFIHKLSLFLYICHPSPPSTAILATRGLSVPCYWSNATQ